MFCQMQSILPINEALCQPLILYKNPGHFKMLTDYILYNIKCRTIKWMQQTATCKLASMKEQGNEIKVSGRPLKCSRTWCLAFGFGIICNRVPVGLRCWGGGSSPRRS